MNVLETTEKMGHGLLQATTRGSHATEAPTMTHASAYHRRLHHARQPRQHHVKPRRLQQARARLQREQGRAQRSLQALEQALVDWGLPETLAPEVEGRLQTVGKRRGQIFGGMCPTLFGCRTADERTRVRLWDKTLPGHILGAGPRRSGGARCRTGGRICWRFRNSTDLAFHALSWDINLATA
jgi:hypothetical protein